METIFWGSTGIFRCEKLSIIKINMNLAQNFDMLHNYILASHPSARIRYDCELVILVQLNNYILNSI